LVSDRLRIFCRGRCYLYAYVTTRSLHFAYFGGSSAAKIEDSGVMDSQWRRETRIKVDYSRVVSFFDPALSSPVEARSRKPQEEFRLHEIFEKKCYLSHSL